MEFVKQVNLSIKENGNLSFENDNTGVETQIWHETITREQYGLKYKATEFFSKMIPDGFSLKEIGGGSPYHNFAYYIGEKCIASKTIQIEIIEQGIVGYYSYSNKQIFFYSWDSEFNSLNFFTKLYDALKFKYEVQEYYVIEKLRIILPEAYNIKMDLGSYDHGEGFKESLDIVKFIVTFKTEDESKKKNYRVSYSQRTDEFTFDGHAIYDDEYDCYEVETLGYKQAKIKSLQDEIEEILALKEIIRMNITSEEKIEIPWYEQGKLVEQKKLEQNKADLPRLKARQRNPKLEKVGTHILLSWLDDARKGYYYSGYSKDDIKTELLYRPHYPKGKSGKEHRRNLANGITEQPKINSRTSKKKRNEKNN